MATPSVSPQDLPLNSEIAREQRDQDSRALSQILSEFNLMLRYALSEGLELDDKARSIVATVQRSLITIASTPPTAPPPSLDFEQLMAAHGALAKVIAPATPLSLRATEPEPGLLGSLRRPPLIMWMMIVGAISTVGFVASGILIRYMGNGGGQVAVEKLNWFFAASLGAVFYVLFTAHDYVKDRTFDPRYNPLYVIRFVLGVLAGLILAIVLEGTLAGKSDTVKNLAPAVIALLGGFSTEAVYQILQRMVDMLLTAVRGDDSDNAKTQAGQNASKELLTLADDPAMPAEMKSKAIAAAKRVGA